MIYGYLLIFFLPEDGSRATFRNVVFSFYNLTMHEVQRSCNVGQVKFFNLKVDRLCSMYGEVIITSNIMDRNSDGKGLTGM
jgi:hypothetical protein